MEAITMKYTVIKTRLQYDQYCSQLEELLVSNDRGEFETEIELLTLLIQKFDNEQSHLKESDPITLIHSFMRDHRLKSQNMVDILGISKGYVSDILHYKKGLSKEVIRKLADYFKVRQETFNRPYKLVSTQKTPERSSQGG